MRILRSRFIITGILVLNFYQTRYSRHLRRFPQCDWLLLDTRQRETRITRRDSVSEPPNSELRRELSLLGRTNG